MMSQIRAFPSDLCIKTCYAIMSKNDKLLSRCLADEQLNINEHFPSIFSDRDNFLTYAINYDYDYGFNQLLTNDKLLLSTSDKQQLYQLLKAKGKYQNLYQAIKHLEKENQSKIKYLNYLFFSSSGMKKQKKLKRK